MKIIIWFISLILSFIAIMVFAALHGPVIIPTIVMCLIATVGRWWAGD